MSWRRSAIWPAVHRRDKALTARIADSGFEISRPVKIGNQPRLLRLPTQQFSGFLARSPIVDRGEMREPAEMFCCRLWGFADNRHVQPTADNPGDIPERDAFFSHPVIPAAGCPPFQHKPV